MTAAATNEEAPTPGHDVADGRSAPALRRRLPRPGLGTLVVALALLPVIVAPIRALARGWVAVGDNGLLLLRAQDVMTSDHPLLGTWTSASLGAGESINNPGPLWWDVLAPFVKLGGPSVGLALGVMAANAAAIVLAAWAARRAGGQPAMLVVTALSAGLTWSMGSELLFDAWQPHAMLLAFWAFLVVAWALGTGDLVMAPVLVGVASLIVQTHLSFVYVVTIVMVAAFGGAVWSTRSAGWAGGSDIDRRPSWRRPLLATAIVAVLAWIQPLIDQVAGEGNLVALASAGTSGDGQTIGLRLGTRLVASVVALPPWWGRSGFSETIVATGVVTDGTSVDVAEGNVAGGLVAALGLLVVAAVLGAVIVFGWRRRSRPTVTIGALAAVAVAAALVTTVVTPVNLIGLSPHQLRWLWPISMLVLAAAAFAVATETPRRVVRPVGVAAVAVFAALALPTYAAPEGPTRERGHTETVAQLLDQLEDYDPEGAVLYDTSVLRFAEPYSGPTLAALARNGVDVVVSDEVTIRQIGRGRQADGTETHRVFQVEGSAAATTPAGARRIAFADGLDDAERAELDELRADVIAAASAGGLQLNEAGLAAATAGRLPFEATVLERGGDASAIDAGGWLLELAANEWIDIPTDQQPSWDRFVELDTRRTRFTVALFETPL